MKKLRLLIVMLNLVLLALPAIAAEPYMMPNVTPVMLSENFWLAKLQSPDKIIMDNKQIGEFNQKVIASLPDTVYDLRQYPKQLSKDKLQNLIAVPKQPEDTEYVNGKQAATGYYKALEANCNKQAIAPVATMRWAFTVKRTNIRTYPTNDFIADRSDDSEFDNFQETAIDSAEPVVILHQSASRDWYYVQTYNYRGWLPAKDLAIAANRQQWLEYIDSKEFLTVTARRLVIGDAVFAMGAKLPLASGKKAIKLPARGSKGELTFTLAAQPSEYQVVCGYLPYTRANVLKQVFKMQGERYGWGGMHNSWDCSSLILDVYRSFGLKLPRNADEQERAAGQAIKFSSERASQIANLQPGDAVYMPGHVMMYLGEHDGQPYAIHSLGGHSTPQGRISVMHVVVSDLSIKNRSGKTFLDALTTGKQFQ
ncbi:MAG: NLP/P60-like protein [Firmicutes bacterium]|nr:NLP/P60-like protein [Bacillota bacterium]